VSGRYYWEFGPDPLGVLRALTLAGDTQRGQRVMFSIDVHEELLARLDRNPYERPCVVVMPSKHPNRRAVGLPSGNAFIVIEVELCA
jgi:hypothetical protein